jgi:hypothetical protein
MNIILDTQITPEIREKYLLLELDTFRTSPESPTVTAWCLVDPSDPDDMTTMDQFKDLHDNLMPSFRKRHWEYVNQAIDHLHGRWDGQLDSFYDDLLARVQHLRHSDIDPDWDGTIDRRPLHSQNLPGSDQ